MDYSSAPDSDDDEFHELVCSHATEIASFICDIRPVDLARNNNYLCDQEVPIYSPYLPNKPITDVGFSGNPVGVLNRSNSESDLRPSKKIKVPSIPWICSFCAYENLDPTKDVCTMCEQPPSSGSSQGMSPASQNSSNSSHKEKNPQESDFSSDEPEDKLAPLGSTGGRASLDTLKGTAQNISIQLLDLAQGGEGSNGSSGELFESTATLLTTNVNPSVKRRVQEEQEHKRKAELSQRKQQKQDMKYMQAEHLQQKRKETIQKLQEKDRNLANNSDDVSLEELFARQTRSKETTPTHPQADPSSTVIQGPPTPATPPSPTNENAQRIEDMTPASSSQERTTSKDLPLESSDVEAEIHFKSVEKKRGTFIDMDIRVQDPPADLEPENTLYFSKETNALRTNDKPPASSSQEKTTSKNLPLDSTDVEAEMIFESVEKKPGTFLDAEIGGQDPEADLEPENTLYFSKDPNALRTNDKLPASSSQEKTTSKNLPLDSADVEGEIIFESVDKKPGTFVDAEVGVQEPEADLEPENTLYLTKAPTPPPEVTEAEVQATSSGRNNRTPSKKKVFRFVLLFTVLLVVIVIVVVAVLAGGEGRNEENLISAAPATAMPSVRTSSPTSNPPTLSMFAPTVNVKPTSAPTPTSSPVPNAPAPSVPSPTIRAPTVTTPLPTPLGNNEQPVVTVPPVSTSEPTVTRKFDFTLVAQFPGSVENAQLGSSVATNEDGTIMAAVGVRAINDDETIQVFSRIGDSSVWIPLNPVAWNLIDGRPTSYTSDASLAVAKSRDGTPTIAIASDTSVRVLEYIVPQDEWRPKAMSFIPWVSDDNDGTTSPTVIPRLYGPAVAFSADGSVLAVGSLNEDGMALVVRIFAYDSVADRWSIRGSPITRHTHTQFPILSLSLSLSGSGDAVVISDWVISHPGVTVQSYHWSSINNEWFEVGAPLIFPLGPVAHSLSYNGQRLGVAVPSSDISRVYQLSAGDATWEQIGSDLVGGSSIALTKRGRRALIGRPLVGEAHVVDFDGNDWILSDALVDDDASGRFGAVVSMSADGNVAVVGAPLDDAGSGQVFIFN